MRTLHALSLAATLLAGLAPTAHADRQKEPGLRQVIEAAIKETSCYAAKYDDVVWFALMRPRVETRLRFRLEREGGIDLAIFSSTGQRVRTIAHGTHAAGEHLLRWDGLNDRGVMLPAGVYWAGLESRGTVASQKLIWLGP